MPQETLVSKAPDYACGNEFLLLPEPGRKAFQVICAEAEQPAVVNLDGVLTRNDVGNMRRDGVFFNQFSYAPVLEIGNLDEADKLCKITLWSAHQTVRTSSLQLPLLYGRELYFPKQAAIDLLEKAVPGETVSSESEGRDFEHSRILLTDDKRILADNLLNFGDPRKAPAISLGLDLFLSEDKTSVVFGFTANGQRQEIIFPKPIHQARLKKAASSFNHWLDQRQAS